MLAAATARGGTRIVNAAAEPEVQGTAEMLTRMGARITGAGTHTIAIEGVERLRGCEYEIIPDRLEAGTYAIAAALTGGEVEVRDARPEHLESLTYKLREAGVAVEVTGDTLSVRHFGELRPLTVQALPYPGLATDLQALVAVLLTQAHGVSYIHERVFDNRLLYVGELRKMGADVVTTGTTTAIISGPTPLHGARVQALDVRAGAALILAGPRSDRPNRNHRHLPRRPRLRAPRREAEVLEPGPGSDGGQERVRGRVSGSVAPGPKSWFTQRPRVR